MAYLNYMMLPPKGGHTATLPGNGRKYEGADGVPQAVPNFDDGVGATGADPG